MKILLVSVTLYILLSMAGCKKDDIHLTLIRQSYIGTQLKIDGLYYSTDMNFQDDLYFVKFFYRNGIVRFSGSYYDTLFHKITDWGSNNARFIWGLFLIEGNQIKFEQWTPEGTWIYSGEILNDTTFHIDKLMRSDGKEVRQHDETFHFMEYSPKPDSVNRFIN